MVALLRWTSAPKRNCAYSTVFSLSKLLVCVICNIRLMSLFTFRVVQCSSDGVSAMLLLSSSLSFYVIVYFSGGNNKQFMDKIMNKNYTYVSRTFDSFMFSI